MIVYDITKDESFEDIKVFWYNEVRHNALRYKSMPSPMSISFFWPIK